MAAEGDKQQRVPRAYLASEAFLRAVAFAFDERCFTIYFRGAQDHSALELGELWALRPLMELVLLEQIARAARSLPTGISEPSGAVGAEHQGCDIPLSVLVTSLRDIADADWKELFEQLSEADQVLRQDPAGAYTRMDFESRNLYRGVVQELADHSKADEIEIARMVVEFARGAKNEWSSEPRLSERRSHVGYYLIDKGRPRLEKQIGYQPPLSVQLRKAILDGPQVFYLVSIGLLTFAIIAFLLSGLGIAVPVIPALLLLLLPATESAVGVVNQSFSFLLPPRPLPKLDFSRGIPAECTTVVAVPTLLLNEQQVRHMVRDLEIRYLANRDANLHFALLTDSPDSSKPSDGREPLVKLCSRLIEGLNDRYRDQGGGGLFHFHRRSVYNASEGAWMGWERKRGKLLDFNNLLRGKHASFPVKIGDLSILPSVRYVITLDSDTQLPRDSARLLVGTLAHPLNRAVVDPATNTVVEGYGILQPRVGISVRSASRSRLADIYSGQTGFDLYTRAVSNTYQDLFGEGTFAGKGIYEVDVFQRVLAERFPLNAILSHDLIEGAYARAGLVSDLEVIDDYPSCFSAYSRRKHRWVRGDWQIMRWLLPRVPDYFGKMVPNPLSVLSRWKILDNLRRSLIDSATFLLLLAGWFFLPGNPLHWTVAVLALLVIPAYLQFLLSLSRVFCVEELRGFVMETCDTFITAQVNVFLMLAFLAHQSLVTLDAIVRTLVRMTVTHRKLLEWETAAQTEAETRRKSPVDLYLEWTPLFALVIGALLLLLRPKALVVAAPILVCWAGAGILSQWLNRPMRPGRSEITKEDAEFLRQAALRTWRFFRSFSNAENNWLIPDNFQEAPCVVAQRISPTNLGLLLNARLAAYELGYLSLEEFLVETEQTLTTAGRLRRYNGHFYNWYDTRSLQPAEPLFISTVDSGNLACCLWTLKQGCLQLIERPILSASLWQAIGDHVRLVAEAGRSVALGEDVGPALAELKAWMHLPEDDGATWLQAMPKLQTALLQLDEALSRETMGEENDPRWWIRETAWRLARLREVAQTLMPWLSKHDWLLRHPKLCPSNDTHRLTLMSLPDFLRTLESRLSALCKDGDGEARAAAQSLRSLIPACIQRADSLRNRLQALAEKADALVREMDFRFLYNPRRKVLSVGYDVARRHPKKSCYELLASEARTAAFVAIAKGDVPQESWLHLGRAHTIYEGNRVLLSWSGTMFEYLMPALWMTTYPSTILDQSLRAVVACQRRVSQQEHIPWGVSESACGQTDATGSYQYYAFGLRALALRPKMHQGLVVSPYASFLALAVDASSSVANLRAMEEKGWLGPFGFCEAGDFTSSRVQTPEGCELVRCWMAHHQGMILLAVCNLVGDSAMQNFFHAEPMVAATERLLHERLPRTIAVDTSEQTPSPRRLSNLRTPAGAILSRLPTQDLGAPQGEICTPD